MEQDAAARPLAPAPGRRRRGRLGARRQGAPSYGAPAECPRPWILLLAGASTAASVQPGRSCAASTTTAAVGRSPATSSTPAVATTTTASARKPHGLGILYFGFGFKGAIVEHLYQLSRISSSHGSHYDEVHSGATMIVTEDVSSRSNRYDFDLHRKSARGTTTKETGVRLSIKTQRATIKIMSRQSSIVTLSLT